jgi:hypothetical protein
MAVAGKKAMYWHKKSQPDAQRTTSVALIARDSG